MGRFWCFGSLELKGGGGSTVLLQVSKTYK